MELPSRGSREPNRSEKRRGLEPTRSALEHWIARARQSFVENLHHSETARSLVVRSSGRPGPNVKAQLENDLNVEYDAVKRLNKGIRTCVDAGDNGSRELLEGILTDEEEHIDWLEAQLGMITEIGLQNYLAQQIYEGKE